MTRIGRMLPFGRGFERIMKGVNASIIAVSLDNVWGSIFSFERGSYLWEMPYQIPYLVTVSFGAHLIPQATAFEVRQAVQELQTAAYIHRKKRMRTLGRLFLDTARRHPLRFAMADARVPKMRFHEARTRTVFLARRLKPLWQGQRMVGILLPPSVPGALVNFAAVLCGKVPVNLNYTASGEILASCARQCEIETVVTSRAFLERVNIEVPAKPIFVEDLAARPRFTEKIAALAMSLLFPWRLVDRALWRPAARGVGVIYRPTPLDLAAIGEIARKYGITFLLATPTFLQAYLRRCAPEDFGSVQLVMVGAEKLPERLAQAFEDRFGIRPLEGYGCTECSPVVAVATRDF